MIPITLVKRALSNINPWRTEGTSRLAGPCNKELVDTVFEVQRLNTSSLTTITGAPRQGKSYSLQALIARLLDDGVSASQILLVDFDSVMLRTAELAVVLSELDTDDTNANATKYLFMDNTQWLDAKQLKDVDKTIRGLQPVHVVLTGSTLGNWKTDWEASIGGLEIHKHEVTLRPFHFVDYLNICGVDTSGYPRFHEFKELFRLREDDFSQLATHTRELEIHFEKYLRTGAHPAALAQGTEAGAQEWTRRELINRVLQEDVPVAHKGRTPADIGRVLVQVAINDDRLFDMSNLCKVLDLARPVAEGHLKTLVKAGLVKRISPPDYDSAENRAMHMVLAADPSILTALQFDTGNSPTPGLSRQAVLGSAVYMHLRWGGHPDDIKIGHGHSKRHEGPQFVIQIGQNEFPFDVRCLDRKLTDIDLRSIGTYCLHNGLKYGLMVTQSSSDIGWTELKPDGRLGSSSKLANSVKILRIPSALLCFWWSIRGHRLRAHQLPLSDIAPLADTDASNPSKAPKVV